jgi:hypothetical protein
MAFEWSAQRWAGSSSARVVFRLFERLWDHASADVWPPTAPWRARPSCDNPRRMRVDRSVPQSVLGRPLQRLANNRHFLCSAFPAQCVSSVLSRAEQHGRRPSRSQTCASFSSQQAGRTLLKPPLAGDPGSSLMSVSDERPHPSGVACLTSAIGTFARGRQERALRLVTR